MGVVICYAKCAGCGLPMGCNPITVPSIRINGLREPICRACVDTANPLRIANGLPPIEPAEEAYSGCDEDLLNG